MKYWRILLMNLFSLQVNLSVCNELNTTLSSTAEFPLDCPPWFFYNDSVHQCQCFETFNLDIRCTSEEALLRFGRCMTYQEGAETALSSCHYFLIDVFLDNVTEGFYITLPRNITLLNDYMCQPLNRKGFQCSECLDGFGVSVTSLGYPCSDCTGVWYGIPLYLFVELVPITVFFVIILVYRINITLAPMTSFIMVSQLIAYAVTLSPEDQSVTRVILNEGFGLLNFVVALYGIWNLDFFRYIIPPFCISPNLKLIHVLFMSYISALYPICLIIVTWIWIELVSRGYKPLVWIWKTVGRCCCGAKWKLEKKHTIIDAFATFLLLSYTKLLIQSLTILAPSSIQLLSTIGNYSEVTRSLDPSIDFYGREHLPFALFANVILIAFVILPALLLALFPFKAFRSLLSKLKLFNHRKAAFYLFVEKFYSCYRDGLDGGKDLRGLASLYFFLRFILLFLHQSTLELFGLSGRGTGDAEIAAQFLQAILLAVATIFIGIVRPYKEAYMNILDTLLLSTLTLLLFFPLAYLFALSNIDSRVGDLLFHSSIIVLCLPQIGFGVYLFVKFYRSKKPLVWLQTKYTNLIRKHRHSVNSRHDHNSIALDERAANLESLPDRFVHPDLYYIEAEDSF